MLKIEKTVLPSPEQWEIIIEGMRNPKNSWDRMDSFFCHNHYCDDCKFFGADPCYGDSGEFELGLNDHKLMDQLNEGGPVHAKYRRMINVYVTLSAPLYFWKEFDTYKLGTVCNSCSTMHKIHAKEFELDDFSREHMCAISNSKLIETVQLLNIYRNLFIDWNKYDDNTKNALLPACDDSFLDRKTAWWQMIQLLPTSYNQKRTIMLNYEVLANIYQWRRGHKLDEWHIFCDWIRSLPYSELITGEKAPKEDCAV